jgi:D-alanyl-D-alanine carboxypeptidase (penicillin-binding protein 5/6)
MGSPKVGIRNKDARKLIDYGFANFNSLILAKKDDKIQEVNVSKGSRLKINAVAESDVSVLLNKGEEKNVTKRAELPEVLSAPIKKGEKIGELVVSINDKEVGRYNLISDTDVSKSTFLNNLRNAIIYWLGNQDR